MELVARRSRAPRTPPGGSPARARTSSSRPRGGTGCPRRRRAGTPGSRSARSRQDGVAPAGSSNVSWCQWNTPVGFSRWPSTGSPAAAGVGTMSSQPLRARTPVRTSAPSARASTCAPRQMPSTGTPSPTASASSRRSIAEKRVLVLLPRVRVATERDDPAAVAQPADRRGLSSQTRIRRDGRPDAWRRPSSTPRPGRRGSCSIASIGFTSGKASRCAPSDTLPSAHRHTSALTCMGSDPRGQTP